MTNRVMRLDRYGFQNFLFVNYLSAIIDDHSIRDDKTLEVIGSYQVLEDGTLIVSILH